MKRRRKHGNARHASWLRLSDVLRRLEHPSETRRALINTLLLGVDVHFGWNGRMFIKINEAEADELRAGRPIRKIQTLADAVASTPDWKDVTMLPNIEPKPKPRIEKRHGFMFEDVSVTWLPTAAMTTHLRSNSNE